MDFISSGNERLLNYDDLKFVLNNQLPAAGEHALKYLDASLGLDFLIILAELYLENEIELDPTLSLEHKRSMRESVIEFASYAFILQFPGIDLDPQIPFYDKIIDHISVVRSSQNNVIKATGPSGPVLRKSAKNFSGSWNKEDIKAAEKAIEEDCEKIDGDEWE